MYSNRKLYAAVLLSLIGCATARPLAPLIPDDPKDRVEEQPLPLDPEATILPDKLPKGLFVLPIDQGQCDNAPKPCPVQSGILSSEERAYRDGLYRLDYKELRTDLLADMQVWSAQRQLYEQNIADLRSNLSDEKTWWNQHKLELGVIGGFIIGAVTVTAVVYAEDKVQK